MFVKVSVGYGEDGKKSVPLDLLLYDSQCWHCSLSGECNAKPNNKCVFSAVASSVQTFRIGKSIGNGEENFHMCSLPHDTGSCDRKEFRYFYNSLERRCKLFVYGGCKGNQNNFLSEIECVKRCGDEAAIAALPSLNTSTSDIQEIDQCSQVKDEGICPGNVPRFYFDESAKRCLLFSYGGCGGNTNNFQSEDGCISTCGGPSGALIHAIQLHGGLKPRKPICNLAINRGACQAKLRRFYFDRSDGTCNLFMFGGCQGNENNFETMEECVINCGGPSDHSTTSGFSFVSSTPRPTTTIPFSKKTTTLSNRQTKEKFTTKPQRNQIISNVSLPRPSTSSEIAFTSINLPSISPCGLPQQIGTCHSFRIRYYFDIDSKTCRKFRFSGCGGNGNNFMTGRNCVKNCGGNLETEVVSKKHITERLVIPTIKTTTTTETPEPEQPTGVRKRKMKRVRVRDRVANNRLAVLKRARLRSSRMSSSSSMVSSSASIVSSEEDQIKLSRHSIRRPARTVSSYEYSYSDDPERVKGPRVDHGEVLSQTDIGQLSDQSGLAKGSSLSVPYIRRLKGRVDQVVRAPPNMKGGLVVIRSYCRHPPNEENSCNEKSNFFFYNVTSASCELKESCTSSMNMFSSKSSCIKSCIVDSHELHGAE